MSRIYIRKSKTHLDRYEVVGYKKIVRTMSKSEAKRIANASRRLRDKKAKRGKK